ncbi:hypothetical protein L6164_026383 [Bauhinia variegata]|uniref:Uncharacterized protein n=1 Tax=Bauhinia variegata TaxID=167791 RepID=A0ACB9LQN6_BAUVA|nr:hypothetical protein L6164_026383 [Bauhinia variegata]
MASSRHFFSSIFLLLILVATGMSPVVAEDRICETLSESFTGLCLSDGNCASLCQTEGFSSGHCSGFRRRCFCTKPCV